jgi:hypothetical protein
LIRASCLLSLRSRAPSRRRLALLAGAGAVAATADVGAAGRKEEGARVTVNVQVHLLAASLEVQESPE